MKKDELTKYNEEFLATIDMKMDLKSYELYQLLFSYISPNKLKKTGEIVLPVKAIIKYMDVDQNLETELKNIVNTLQRQAVYEISNLDKEYKTYATVSAIDQIHWDLEEQIITFNFSQEVIPLILSIKKKYPYFVFQDLASFQKNIALCYTNIWRCIIKNILSPKIKEILRKLKYIRIP
ncbi:TPA: RepB family plasmid replication initiator protein [Enterococcus faecium]